MRIDAYNAVSQIYHSSTVSSVNKKREVASYSDKLEISQSAKDYQTAKEAVSAVSDVREDKVAYIKEQMASGKYSVSSEAVADKILSTAYSLTF
jgi:negative regulator of flagellin synthesis FlgM